jgi:hypothetical protein
MALQRKHAPAERSRTGSADRGTGSGEYKVKGKRATARQRRWINGSLSQAKKDRASRRVMIAVIMTITQESRAGEDMEQTGNDDLGGFQQGRNWISVEGAKDPERATHAFLITGPTSWKRVHGGVKKAPGNLEEAIKRVQISVGGYAQWEEEATRTVDAWLGSDGGEGDSYIKRYSFTRGEQGGERENSWDAAQRLVEEVGAFRWAAGNVFFAASGDELRAQAPALTIRGNEPWLITRPRWSWAAGRAIVEISFNVLADRWDTMPGAAVLMDRRFGAMGGRWYVWNASGASLDSPVATVVLRRPTKLRAEPASERAEREGGEGGGGLEDVCRRISENRSDYLYGGGHGVPLSKLKSGSRMDCSSSCSLALKRAGMFKGSTAIVSGEFATSWGRPGKGDEFTVWANGQHVWIEGYDGDGKPAWRFDTSQHPPPSGPAFTRKARSDQGRFTARHWPGH